MPVNKYRELAYKPANAYWQLFTRLAWSSTKSTDYGQDVPSWTPAENLWSWWEPMTAEEQLLWGIPEHKVGTKVHIRGYPTINDKDRLYYDKHTFIIKGIQKVIDELIVIAERIPFSKSSSATALTPSCNPSAGPLTFTATVTIIGSEIEVPSGTVTFSDGSTSLGTVSLSGTKATFSTAGLSVAIHTIMASYSGDMNFTGSTSNSVLQTVNKASTNTTVTSSTNPSTRGQSVIFTATVSPQLIGTFDGGGTVTFKDGSTSLGTASFGINLLTNGGFETGDFTGWAETGDTNETGVVNSNAHTGSYAAWFGTMGSIGFLFQTIPTIPGNQYVLSWWLKSDGQTPNKFQVFWDGNKIFDQANIPVQGYTHYSYTKIATTTSTTIQFGFRDDPSWLYLDDVSVISVISNKAAFPISSLSAGTYTITAVYGGDSNFTSSTSANYIQVVTP